MFLTEDDATQPLSESAVTELLGTIQRMKTSLDDVETRMRSALLAYLPKVGMQKEDEDGWRQIEAILWNDEGKPEFQVVDKHGAEHLLTATELGDGWTS